jgi:hypothetical protein
MDPQEVALFVCRMLRREMDTLPYGNFRYGFLRAGTRDEVYVPDLTPALVALRELSDRLDGMRGYTVGIPFLAALNEASAGCNEGRIYEALHTDSYMHTPARMRMGIVELIRRLGECAQFAIGLMPVDGINPAFYRRYVPEWAGAARQWTGFLALLDAAKRDGIPAANERLMREYPHHFWPEFWLLMLSRRPTAFKAHLLHVVAPVLSSAGDDHKRACAQGLQTLIDPLRDPAMPRSEAEAIFAEIMTKETMEEALRATGLNVIPRLEALGASTLPYWRPSSDPNAVYMPF